MAKKEKEVEEKIGVVQAINQKFGAGSLISLEDQHRTSSVPAIPTGSISLDIATGIGGVPIGRITEIYGNESSGKTTITLHVIAEAQKKGIKAAFVDAEHAFDVNYASKIGINLKDLLFSQPDSAEQALSIVEMLVESSEVGLIVVDSVAALVPNVELEGDMGDVHMGLQARLMSQAMRKLTGPVSKHKCALVFINQTRQAIGGRSYTTTTGGNALKFYASMRIHVWKDGKTQDKGEDVGIQSHAKIEKNKLAVPFKLANFDIAFGKGIAKVSELIDFAVDLKLITKSGTWFSYNDIKLGQGKVNAGDTLVENHPELLTNIESQIRAHYKLT